MDTQLDYSIEIINKITCKIDSPAGNGTGVLIQTQNTDYLYVLTAKHCLLGEKFSLDFDKGGTKLFIPSTIDGTFETIQLEEYDNVLYDGDHQNDIAVIILKKVDDREYLNIIPKIKILDEKFLKIQCIFRGYPVPYNRSENIIGITIDKVSYVDMNIVTTTTPLNTIDSSSEYNCKGFSGSGVFCFYENEFYLSAIVYEIQEPFQRFPVCQLSQFNEFMKNGKFETFVFSDLIPSSESGKSISLKSLQDLFLKAKSGWLDQRYLVDLHGKGIIYDATEQLLGGKSKRERICKILRDNHIFILKCIREIEYCLAIFDEATFHSELKKVLHYLNTTRENLLTTIESAKDGMIPNKLVEYGSYNLDLCLHLLDKQPKKSISSINASDLKKVLKEIQENEVEKLVHKMYFTLIQKQLIFLGNPGTGKTHGMANVVQVQLEEKNMPAILIQARHYSKYNNWKSILVDVLGLSQHWSEDDIWMELEACATRCQVSKGESKEEDVFVQTELTKVLICIDGIDEASPQGNWINRIGELQVILEKYLRLRVCISSRPYVFSKKERYCFVRLPDDGDINVHELFALYIEGYNIKIVEEETYSWIKWSIKTPFALRLFCEKYTNTKISNRSGVSTAISHLLAQKVKQIDNEIRETYGRKWGEQEELVKRSLVLMAKHFAKLDSSAKIERFELHEMLKTDRVISVIEDLDILRVIDYIVQYGLLYEIHEKGEDPLFEDEKTYYQIQILPLMDYLLAIQTIRDFNEESNRGFPEILYERYGSQQMYALILLQDKGFLLGENGIWEDYYDKDILTDLQLFALSNVSKERVEQFTEWVKDNFRRSMPLCRKVVNQLVARVARIKKHPLGPLLVHDILSAYASSAERDKLWSVPEQLDYNCGAIWEGSGKVICSVKEFNLLTEDDYDGLPLIYAWQLTSVDNKVRNECRKQLTRWGIQNPRGFLNLLDFTFNTNDPQMKEDLFCCVFGIISKLSRENEETKELAEWIIINIFEDGKIQNIRNAVLRFAGRAVIERAYSFQLIDEKKLRMARPPYLNNTNLVGLNQEAVEETEKDRDGFSPITGDLAWYVIKKGYEGFFEIDDEQKEEYNAKEHSRTFGIFQEQREKEDPNMGDSSEILGNDYSEEQIDEFLQRRIDEHNKLENEEEENTTFNLRLSKDAIKFLEQNALLLGKKVINPHQFSIGFGVEYIKKMGWNEVEFYGSPIGGKPGEILAVDISITRKYYPSTHGSQSSIMSIAEKYTWCAVHEMIGYLADRLPFYYYGDYGKIKNYVDDYSRILDIPNPVQELTGLSFDKVRAETGWYIPNDLSPTMDEYKDDNPDEVKGWIKDAPYPDIYRWIASENDKMTNVRDYLEGSWTCLFNYSRITEPLTRCDSQIWIESFLVSNDDYEILRKDCKDNKLLEKHFIHDHNNYSSPNTDTYMDPSALCWMNWIEDSYGKIDITTTFNCKPKEYAVFKCLSEVTCKSAEGSEVSFTMPSKMMRDLLRIQEGDGWDYFNYEKKLSAFFAIVGTAYRESQTLLYADTNTLKQVLDDNQLRMFWNVRISRVPSLKTSDKYKGLFHSKDKYWLMFDNGDTLEKFEICKTE